MKWNDIFCMDALEGVRMLPNESVHLIVIDPPYLNIVDESWDRTNPMTIELIQELNRVLKPSGSIYVWCGIGEKSRSLLDFIPKLDACFHFKDLITWKKQRGIGMRKGWLYTREELLWYVKDNKQFVWNQEYQYSSQKRAFHVYRKGGEMVNKSEYKRITNVWDDIYEVGFGSSPKKFKEIRDEIPHLTPKPIEAIMRIISLHTQEHDVVLDCFMGSGTTALACIQSNRNYIGFDNNPDYVRYANLKCENIKRGE